MPHTNNTFTNGASAMSKVDNEALKILVVGAGIGGLTAALALRQQGHNVTLFESSKFSNETGAAIHMAPNANGLLRRLGLYLEEYGANEMTNLAQYDACSGKKIMGMNLKKANSIWQHPWHLIHRAHLHTALREKAVDEEGVGKPATLRLASKVASLDPQKAEITLESGEVVSGDLILGADGVHSICRKYIPDGNNYTPKDCGHSAYRFLVSKEEVMKDPLCREFCDEEGLLCMIIGEDRRVVVYPCVNNTLLNFLLIHPSNESQSSSPSEGWNESGNKKRMLEIGSGFAPQVRALLEKAPEDTLKLWTLLDMDVLPTWINGSMALLGDAAHPFLPHQAQGGGQAMEDAISLAAILPPGTAKEDVPERLRLYEKCRRGRANNVQEATRRSGMSLHKLKKLGLTYSPTSFTNYNFGHDEWDSSNHALKKHLWSKGSYRFRQPLSFGPSPGPRQPKNQLPDILSHARQNQTVASIRFTTSRTYLQTLLPTEQFSFTEPGTIAQASIICCTLRNMTWLGDTGYTHCGLYLHGVQYKKRSGEVLHGTFLPILFENLTDPIITGREEIAAPKWGCDIDVVQTGDSRNVKLSWRGAIFVEMDFNGLQDGEPPAEIEHTLPKPRPDNGMFMYRYVPAVGEPGKADAEYAVFEEFPQPTDQASTGEELDSKFSQKNMTSTKTARSANIKITPGDWDSLPTLHHVAEGWSQVPVYQILEATVKEVPHVGDVRAARRIE